MIQRDEKLRCHGGVDLAHTADAGNDVRADLIELDACGRLQRLRVFRVQQALDLAAHGINQTNGHVTSSLQMCCRIFCIL